MKKLALALFVIIWIAGGCVKSLTVNPDRTISLTLDTLTLNSGTSQQLVSKNYSASDLRWKSADTSVAAVSGTGLLTAKSVGQSVITVNTKSGQISATCLVIVTPAQSGDRNQINGKGSDIGIGADGSVFVVGIDSVSPTGGLSISKLIGNSLVKMPECAAIRIAVSPQGVPWVVNKSKLIYRYNGRLWDVMPGTATDIGIGADGSVFIVGTTNVSPTGGNDIMKWNGTGWDTLRNCAGVHIAVSPQGIPWVVNKSNVVYQNTGGELWNPVPGVAATDIGVGADGSVFVTGTENTPKIYRFSNGGWSPLPGVSGVSISVSPTGTPYWTDKSNSIFKLN